MRYVKEHRNEADGRTQAALGKPEYIKPEIWAKLIAYNIAETLISHTIIKHGNTKHENKVNFSRAAHICRVFLRLTIEKDSKDVMTLL